MSRMYFWGGFNFSLFFLALPNVLLASLWGQEIVLDFFSRADARNWFAPGRFQPRLKVSEYFLFFRKGPESY